MPTTTAPAAAGLGPADAIVVLGAQAFASRPSAELQARLVHAAELWAAGAGPRVVCSGGWDGEICEPLVMAAALVELGVPDSVVEADDRGFCTRRTVEAAAEHAQGDTGRVVLVSSPYHLRRLRIEARRAGLDAATSAPESTPITRNRRHHAYQLVREALAICRIPARRRRRA